ncbi:MAG: M23 family metallopeptidase [Oscillospiraceae bacterium]|nr:M23 family metallopeptidase [Oscillospiraceae bacterium]MBQ2920030.1 M23 family metallopeptidase [Oscillospiraceae bacterium]
MSDNKHGRAFSGKGYYIALVLCAAAIGITSYVYYAGREDPAVQTANLPASITGTVSLPTASTAPAGTDGTTEATAGKLATCAPVEGEVLSPYAMEVLSYNQTTRDWRIHNGVDLAAAAGTPVMAAADGQVYTVYEDDQLGMTVVIRHEGGYTTRYSSLGADVTVSAGQQVSMGQPIGTVGTSALMENALGDHVHFAVTKDDEPVDPMDFLE